jgi:hypothetical protein
LRAAALIAAVPLALLLGSFATASAQEAASVNAPCVVENGAVIVSGTGFIPGDGIEVNGIGLFGTTAVDPTGAFSVEVFAPNLGTLRPDATTETISVNDLNHPGATPITSFGVDTLAAAIVPGDARPAKRVTFVASGFVPGEPIYGHYLRRGRVRATKRLGIAAGPCGTLDVKSAMYPAGRTAAGTYKVQFDQSPTYSRQTPKPKATQTVTIL